MKENFDTPISHNRHGPLANMMQSGSDCLTVYKSFLHSLLVIQTLHQAYLHRVRDECAAGQVSSHSRADVDDGDSDGSHQLLNVPHQKHLEQNGDHEMDHSETKKGDKDKKKTKISFI